MVRLTPCWCWGRGLAGHSQVTRQPQGPLLRTKLSCLLTRWWPHSAKALRISELASHLLSPNGLFTTSPVRHRVWNRVCGGSCKAFKLRGASLGWGVVRSGLEGLPSWRRWCTSRGGAWECMWKAWFSSDGAGRVYRVLPRDWLPPFEAHVLAASLISEKDYVLSSLFPHPLNSSTPSMIPPSI